MYIPLSMLPLTIINKVSVMIGTSSLDYIVPKLFFYTLLGMVSCVIAILLLQKIPTWISELLGTANQGVGVGGALGMLKTAGMGLGGIGKMAISNVLDSQSKKGGIARTIANVATGGVSAGIETIAKGGFRALAGFFKKNKD